MDFIPKYRILLFPGGIISLSCLILLAILYISHYYNINPPYSIELNLPVCEKSLTGNNFEGDNFESTKLDCTIIPFASQTNDSLKIVSLLNKYKTSCDSTYFIKLKLNKNITYNDFVQIIDLINASSLDFDIKFNPDEFIIWNSNTIKYNSNDDHHLFAPNCIAITHNSRKSYQTSKEMNFLIDNKYWLLWIILTGWLILSHFNIPNSRYLRKN